MCLIFYKDKRIKIADIELIEAEKTIIVYKRLLRKKITWFNGIERDISPYQNLKYDPFSVYTVDGKIEISYNGKCYFNKRFLYEVYQGLHAYVSLEHAHKYAESDEKVVRMYIPKGAFYIIGENGNIVSNILITKDLKHVKKPRKKSKL